MNRTQHQLDVTFSTQNYAKAIGGTPGAWLIQDCGRINVVNTLENKHTDVALIQDTYSFGLDPRVNAGAVQAGITGGGPQNFDVTRIALNPISREEAQKYMKTLTRETAAT